MAGVFDMSDPLTLKQLGKSQEAARWAIWQAKDALYEYVRTNDLEKAKIMAYRIEVYEAMFEELWPPENLEIRQVKVPPKHGLQY